MPQDSEGGRVTYVFVHGQQANGGHGGPQRQQQIGQPKPQDQGVMNYGATTTNNSNSHGGHRTAQGGSSSAAAQAGSSSAGGDNAPPTYAEAVKGDNKIQTQD